jgi:glycosyltransferase 2 family protein
MSTRLWDRSLLLTAMFVAVISAASIWIAWNASVDLAQRLSWIALAPILTAALFSYLMRILRFHYFLTRSGVPMSLRNTTIVQVIGFALSVTPGHLGEVFKLHLIRERAGTPLTRTAPLLLLDRVTEGGGFLILAVLSAAAMPALTGQIPTPWLILAALAAMLAFALARPISRRLPQHRVPLEQLGPLRRIVPHVRDLWHGINTSFTTSQILGGLLLSATARFADGLVVLLAAHWFGVDLPLPAGVFVLAVSGLAGGISFLPAGAGAVETTMVALLVLLGAPLPNALAITFVARLATLWLWVGIGLGVAFARRVNPPRVRT